MNSRWLISLVVWLFVAVTGCGGAHRYDGRLVLADSLMQHSPDSALALVEAVSPDSLAAGGDRAYRDLLLTQARYKCYIAATSDSAINRALNYYRQHDDEREKLTRAYIYKGAVMEELGHPDSAMLYYKTAEANAAEENDYFNLGQINMRMGALYRDHYSIDGKDIEKYESAYKYLSLTDDKHYQLVCMINLGSLYRLNDSSKAESILRDAMSLALDIGDTAKYLSSAQNLITMYSHYKRFDEAKKLISHVNTFPRDKIKTIFYITAAKIYAKQNMLDSAEYYLNLSKPITINGPIEQLSLLECLSEVALAQGDQLKHLEYVHQCKQLTDSLKALQETVKILNSEHEYDQVAKSVAKHKHKRTIYMFFGLIIIMLLLFSFVFYRHKHRYDIIIKDFKQQSETHLSELAELQHNVSELKINDEQLKDFINSHMALMKDMIEASYHAPNSVLSKDIRNIIKFQDRNKNNWEKLYDYIDIEYNNIMTETRRNYPQLTGRDILLLALTCLGYSCAQIAIIMGYSNASTIGGNRQRLAKKMGLEGSLKDYTQQFR